MKSARLDFADPEHPVTLADVEPPALPRGDWARVAVTAGGICGSDLHAIFPDGSGTPTFLPLVGFPMELGHEFGGVVTEAGPDCAVPVGARVAVDPMVACVARGLTPCAACRSGRFSSCEAWNVGEPSGFGHGFASGIGGGWSDSVVAHTTQLHPAPDAVDDRGLALAVPLSIAIHGVLRRLPPRGVPCVIIGAGTIGLASVAALKSLAPSNEVHVLARHAHQVVAARALGADRVLVTGENGDDVAALAELAGGRVTGTGRASLVWGGHPYVVDAVGSPSSLNLALKIVGQEGTLLLLGAIANAMVDLGPLWFKNVDVVGSFGYAMHDHGGARRHTFDMALDLLASGAFPSDVIVSHTFPLTDVREALRVAQARDEGARKVQLLPG
jgi:threonine dehydrogenase-like Zn-dependent dehydrogenase